MTILRRQVSVLVAALLGAVLLLTLPVFSPAAWGQSPGTDVIDEDPEGEPYAAGELLVTYKEDTSQKKEESVEREVRAEVEEDIPEIDTRVLELPEVKDGRAESARERELEQIKKKLEKDPAVESVDYNYVYQGFYTPKDPRFSSQWGLRKTGFEKAWSRTRGATRVKIAIVDSGAAINHVDLKRKVVAKRDFVNDNYTVEDLHGHGTHIAGIAAARTGNKTGVAGGCPGCRLIIAKALDRNLYGYHSDIIDAIIWSANKKARVINLSLGGTTWVRAMKKATNYAQSKGAVVVAAGGNYGDNRSVYPAAHRGVIGVSHTNRQNRRVFDASYGNWIDVAAPGYQIVSTVPGGYTRKSGSSMASPHVASLAGLLASKGYGKKRIKRRIMGSAQDLGSRGRDPYYGRGLIRADRAVR